MALTHVGVGSGSTFSSGATTVTVPHASPASGDGEVLFVMTKPETLDATAAPGFTRVGAFTGGAGAFGADTGPCRVTVFVRDTCDGSEGTTSVTVTLSAAVTNSACMGRILRFSKSAGARLLASIASGGSDDVPASNWAVTHGTTPDWAAGDLLYLGLAIPVDSPLPTFGTDSLTATGLTVGVVNFIANPTTAAGNQMGSRLSWYTITAGSAPSAAPVHTIVLTGTTTNVAGPEAVVRLRELLPNPRLRSGRAAVVRASTF